MLLSLLLMTVCASAVPAKRGIWATITLADGSQVRATLVGDEHLHFMIAEDGTRYVRSQQGDFYVKADIEAMTLNAEKRVMKANRHRNTRLRKAMKARGDFATNQFIGEKKGLIILVNFQKKSFASGHNQALFNDIANAENYTGNGFKGSVSDYFRAQSGGQFLLTFDVVGPVTLSKEYKYYGENDSDDNDMRPEEMVVEACQLVDGQVDFSKYDWDGDGEVDQVFILYAGHGEADYYYKDTDVVWPHEWELSASDKVQPITLDGVTINTYACSNEINLTGGLDGISTICHEFSHCLGYPDLYDTRYQGHFGMGEFDLMCSGTSNDNGYTPPAYSGYERWVAGWQQPIELTEYTEVKKLKPITDGGEFYVIYNDGNKNEYYVLENRQQKGYDKYIPSRGLMITHVDYTPGAWEYNVVNTIGNYYDENQKVVRNDHQRLTIFHADNDDDSQYWMPGDYYSEQTTSTDLYPANGNNKLTNNSAPAAKLYNKNADGSKLMSKPITNITQNSDGTVSFVFGATESDDPVTGDGEFVKVTRDDQIALGNEYILVCEQYAKSPGAIYSGWFSSYFQCVDITLDGNTANQGDAQVFTLGGSSAGYSLRMADGKYVSATSAKSIKSSSTAEATWLITPTDDGYVVDAKSTTYVGRIWFNYNSGYTPRFTNYTSTSGLTPAVLYVKNTATGIGRVKVAGKAAGKGIYSLDGRYLGTDLSPLGHGIYIVDGKKVAK